MNVQSSAGGFNIGSTISPSCPTNEEYAMYYEGPWNEIRRSTRLDSYTKRSWCIIDRQGVVTKGEADVR
jgi:hypothetical protein